MPGATERNRRHTANAFPLHAIAMGYLFSILILSLCSFKSPPEKPANILLIGKWRIEKVILSSITFDYTNKDSSRAKYLRQRGGKYFSRKDSLDYEKSFQDGYEGMRRIYLVLYSDSTYWSNIPAIDPQKAGRGKFQYDSKNMMIGFYRKDRRYSYWFHITSYSKNRITIVEKESEAISPKYVFRQD